MVLCCADIRSDQHDSHKFEAQAVTWQAGSHQPDCQAALTVAHDVLSYGGDQVAIVSPLDTERRMRRDGQQAPAEWMTRSISGGRHERGPT